jgi:hypothetical protein
VQWTDFVLYSPYVGLGPSRKLLISAEIAKR